MKEKTYTLGEVLKTIEETEERTRIIIEYLLNKNSDSTGINYKQFYEDMEDFCNSLIR